MSSDIEPGGATPPSELSSPCRSLRNKGMYVYTDGSGTPHDDYDNTIYWCLKTMKSFGPDDEPACGDDCRSPARECYQPT